MGYKSIGRQLQLAREEAGYNQEQLAAKIGCSQSALSNYEKGKRRIYLAQLEKIAEILNKPIEFFLRSAGSDSANRAMQFSNEPVAGPDTLPLAEIGPGHPVPHPALVGQEQDMGAELLAMFQTLSPEGQKLVYDFITWLKKREVEK